MKDTMSQFNSNEESSSSVPPQAPRQGGGLTLLIVALLIGAAGVAFVAFMLLSGDEDSDESTVEPIQPVPAVALTPLWDALATLEAATPDPAATTDPQLQQNSQDIAVIRQQLEAIDAENISQADLNTVLTELDGVYLDAEDLRGELTTFITSDEFGEGVRGEVEQMALEATQTQSAVECVVETLPEYSSVVANVQPSDAEPRADFLFEGRNYRVIGRTDGAINTQTLWWQIEIDVANNIRGWVRSDFVAESNNDKCLAIAIR
jgi:hypothetical protein